MGEVGVIKQLRRFGACLDSQNVRGETPFMRAVGDPTSFEQGTFPLVLKELFRTVDCRDASGCTIIHHIMKSGVLSELCARSYLVAFWMRCSRMIRALFSRFSTRRIATAIPPCILPRRETPICVYLP